MHTFHPKTCDSKISHDSKLTTISFNPRLTNGAKFLEELDFLPHILTVRNSAQEALFSKDFARIKPTGENQDIHLIRMEDINPTFRSVVQLQDMRDEIIEKGFGLCHLFVAPSLCLSNHLDTLEPKQTYLILSRSVMTENTLEKIFFIRKESYEDQYTLDVAAGEKTSSFGSKIIVICTKTPSKDGVFFIFS